MPPISVELLISFDFGLRLCASLLRVFRFVAVNLLSRCILPCWSFAYPHVCLWSPVAIGYLAHRFDCMTVSCCRLILNAVAFMCSRTGFIPLLCCVWLWCVIAIRNMVSICLAERACCGARLCVLVSVMPLVKEVVLASACCRVLLWLGPWL